MSESGDHAAARQSIIKNTQGEGNISECRDISVRMLHGLARHSTAVGLPNRIMLLCAYGVATAGGCRG